MNAKATDDPIQLYLKSEDRNENNDLIETAQQLVRDLNFTEWWAWFEPFPNWLPDGKPGRAAHFSPWAKGWPKPGDAPLLSEIRLSGCLQEEGKFGGCHLLRDEEGAMRWFAFSECDFSGATPVEGVQKLPFYPVLQRRDIERRFFLDSPRWLKIKRKLKIVEYWRGDRRLAWALLDMGDSRKR